MKYHEILNEVLKFPLDSMDNAPSEEKQGMNSLNCYRLQIKKRRILKQLLPSSWPNVTCTWYSMGQIHIHIHAWTHKIFAMCKRERERGRERRKEREREKKIQPYWKSDTIQHDLIYNLHFELSTVLTIEPKQHNYIAICHSNHDLPSGNQRWQWKILHL